MKCKVYRALDRPSVFFGIKGRFITWYLLLAGAALMLSVAVGIATAGVFGFVLFILGAAGVYVLIMLLQDRTSDREFSIRLDARKYPRFYRLRPQPFRVLLDAAFTKPD
jgi:hypothetical protein